MARAYYAISADARLGVDQRKGTFWENVAIRLQSLQTDLTNAEAASYSLANPYRSGVFRVGVHV